VTKRKLIAARRSPVVMINVARSLVVMIPNLIPGIFRANEALEKEKAKDCCKVRRLEDQIRKQENSPAVKLKCKRE
jgi:Na+/phosphate symporter